LNFTLPDFLDNLFLLLLRSNQGVYDKKCFSGIKYVPIGAEPIPPDGILNAIGMRCFDPFISISFVCYPRQDGEKHIGIEPI